MHARSCREKETDNSLRAGACSCDADQERGDVEVEFAGVLEREHLELRFALALGDTVTPVGPFGARGQREELERFQSAAASLRVIFDIQRAQRLIELRSNARGERMMLLAKLDVTAITRDLRIRDQHI